MNHVHPWAQNMYSSFIKLLVFKCFTEYTNDTLQQLDFLFVGYHFMGPPEAV